MKTILGFFTCLLLASACMKTKEEYRQTIDDIQKEEAAPEDQNPERSRGSNDLEGMGDVTE